MKLSEAIARIKRDEAFSSSPDMKDLCDALNISYYDIDYDREDTQTRLKSYWLMNWYCTDSVVGLKVYFFDDEVVACSAQAGRKSDTNFEFVSQDAAEKLHAYMLTFLREPKKPEYPILNMDEEIEEFYTIDYTDGILHKEAMYKGEQVKIVESRMRQEWDAPVRIEKKDGTQLEVEAGELNLRILIKD